jgi:predicted TPR repeat methyltransferase
MGTELSIDAAEWERLGIEADSNSRHADAEQCFSRAVALDDNRSISWVGLAFSLINQKRMDDAVASLQRAHAARPACGIVGHLLNAMTGATSQRAPNDYVAFVFNGYAGNFDSHLANLQYRGPQMLAALAQRAGWAADGSRHIFDLGCGTGLSGLPFRAHAARLEGADLAAAMLQQAVNRGIYDHLWHGELHAVLRQLPPASFDAALAADTLIYIGDVAELFRLVHAMLKPGGDFLFTVEIGSGGFMLTRSGRYQHDRDYLLGCAAGLFISADSLDTPIRVEAGQAQPGRAYRFVKPV